MAADARLLIESQVCFKLYVASRAIIRAYRDVLEPFGLSYPQYLVLLVLWEHDGLSVSEIGARLDLDSGTLTPLLKKLERAAFLKRVRSREDERSVNVVLARKGRSLRAEGLAIRAHVVRCTGMKEKDLQALGRQLDGLVAQIHHAPVRAA